ncbi:hypothetical protein EXIGLDRAFT_695027 [Exidia glandulosa HHB12029]|uniref:Uncharacterized protein n=1 Tax=Exidia glandulosa HHB12029 TaxID=1314781 RepID=A0A165G658_EXIGL|nr:hypothetical protein EXIGLDRAFT_695027 [Exidia glandulosa HHB12029]
MGRHPKYKSDEERAEARRVTKRAYYARNVDRERELSRKRWNSKRAKSARSQVKEACAAPVLVATERLLGASLTPHSRTAWAKLIDALNDDLATWRRSRSPADEDEYNALICELISCRNQEDSTAQRLLARIARKKELLSSLCGVARAADNMLLDLHPGTSTVMR